MGSMQLVGSNGDGRLGFEECRKLNPELIIVDLMLPGLNGMEIVHQIKSQTPETKIIVFSGYSSRDRVQTVLKAGVEGIVHKNASIDELEQGIRKVAAGESYMSSEIMGTLRDIMLFPEKGDTPEKLTAREREVLQLVAEGYTTKEIASRLNISVKTADTHRSHIMQKLGIHDVAGLTRFAIQHGIIQAG
jgi:DNA-binding NarL/FixJ family response regulator